MNTLQDVLTTSYPKFPCNNELVYVKIQEVYIIETSQLTRLCNTAIYRRGIGEDRAVELYMYKLLYVVIFQVCINDKCLHWLSLRHCTSGVSNDN